MRVPSVAKLTEILHLSREQASLIRALGHATNDGEKLSALVEEHVPQTLEYVRSLYSDPYNSHLWRTTIALHAMDVICETSGVEPLGPPRGGDYAPPYEYLNTGDPYNTTLVYRRKTDTLNIGCWGDIAEKHPSWE